MSITIFLFLLITNNCSYSQNIAEADTSRAIQRHMDSIIVSTLGSNYSVVSVLDVDERIRNADYRVYQNFGYIFDDPYGQLSHSFIVNIDNLLSSDTVLIGVINDSKLVWRSNPFYVYPPGINLEGFGDLNNDGITDILFSSRVDMRGLAEALWVLSPDSLGGKFLNQLDGNNLSSLWGAFDCFEILPTNGKVVKIIRGIIPFSENLEEIKFIWDGKVFK